MHVERRQRVFDCRDDRRRRRDGAALARAFDAEGIERIDGLDMGDGAGRYVGRHRQQIIGERGGQRLRVLVVLHPLNSALPMPWATPPCTWPSTISGLMTRPESWAT